MTQLIELTYVSEPAQAMSFLGLMRLLYHSYSNNQALGITGVLIYENDRFGQVIQGKADQIDALWNRIQKDQRHKNVRLIDRKPISERTFSKWTMVFQGRDEIANALPEVKGAIEDIEFPIGHPLLLALKDKK
jgi:hypothetical protein